MCVCIYIYHPCTLTLSYLGPQTSHFLFGLNLTTCGLSGEAIANREISRFHEPEMKYISAARAVTQFFAVTRFICRLGTYIYIYIYIYIYVCIYIFIYMYTCIYNTSGGASTEYMNCDASCFACVSIPIPMAPEGTAPAVCVCGFVCVCVYACA